MKTTFTLILATIATILLAACDPIETGDDASPEARCEASGGEYVCAPSHGFAETCRCVASPGAE